MNDTLTILPRFEVWNQIKRQGQSVRACKNVGISIAKEGSEDQLSISSDQANDDDWSVFTLLVSSTLLHESVAVDRDIWGGKPVLRGTRITLSQILIEISNGETVAGFADEYDIDADTIRKFFEGLAIHLDRSFTI